MNESTVQEALAPYGLSAAHLAIEGEKRMLLRGITWATYKALSKDLGNSRSSRLAFNSGEMEIMSPLIPHENSQFSISQMVIILAEETGTPCRAVGSLTCEREDLEKAIEPDGCFYIQNLNRVRGLSKLDFSIHPPPDLMIEVDISTKSMNKLAICAALGVPEHWRFDGKKLEIRILKDGKYYEASESRAFPGLQFAQKVAAFVQTNIDDDATSMNRQIRAWIRNEMKKQKSSKNIGRSARQK